MKDVPRKLKSSVFKGITWMDHVPSDQGLRTVAQGDLRKDTTHVGEVAFVLLMFSKWCSLLASFMIGDSIGGNRFSKRMAFAVTPFPSVYCPGSSWILARTRLTRWLALTPEFLIQLNWGGAQGDAFPTSSQLMLMLLVWGPCFEKQCSQPAVPKLSHV